MPQTDEPSKKREKVNCLSDILLELMDSRKIEPAQIHKATGIAYTTLSDWMSGKVGTQMADKNLLKLAQFFSVSLEYLCYGIGSEEYPYERFDKDKTI
jgi:transcriptional regulator with XRE-family HTH domain